MTSKNTTNIQVYDAIIELCIFVGYRWFQGWFPKRFLQFLDFLASYDGICCCEFCSATFFVIERTFVLVSVSMEATEQFTDRVA